VPARRRFNGGGLCLPAEGSLSAPTTEPLVGKKVVVAEVAGDSSGGVYPPVVAEILCVYISFIYSAVLL